MKPHFLVAALALAIPAAAPAQPAPTLSATDKAAILDKTQTIRLAPDIAQLGPGERVAVAKLSEVGRIVQDIYEEQRHRSALTARARLQAGTPDATLYRLFQGPIATTLDNKRVPFLPVNDAPPGKNVYPWDLTAAEYEAYLKAHPQRRDELTHLRSVVRRATRENLTADLAALAKYPVLDTLHPGLRARWQDMLRRPSATDLYAAPYSIAYADRTIRAHGLLNEAANAVEGEDWEFARYLRNRARDLLSDDYESGDAAWITGQTNNLNAQIGAYETYDDEISGTRAFYALNVLARRKQETEALRKGLQGIQALENALPYDRRKRVRDDIPVGVYDVVVDFGQSRGGNTATILPNEAYLARRYGRTILLRANIMRNPQIFSAGSDVWKSVVAPQFAGHLTADSNFQRTLWHEVGHYLGVDRTADGRDLDTALGADGNLLEEMKADLVSLFSGKQLRAANYYTEDQLRSLYASGINRTLQNNRPRRDQPYQSMQLMQFNWFLDKQVLRFDPATTSLSIDYGRYHEAVEGLLREVLALQDAGDPARSDAFVKRWSAWDDNLHGRIAAKMRGQQRYRYRLFTYGALGE